MNIKIFGLCLSILISSTFCTSKYEIKKFRTNKDKAAVLALLKSAWKANLNGDYDEKFLCDHVINPVHPGPIYKYVKVIKDTKKSFVVGITTGLYFPALLKECSRGYIELLISDPDLTPHDRQKVEKRLIKSIINTLKKHDPEKYQKYVRESNTISVALFKKEGFKEVEKGASPDGNSWFYFERQDQNK